MHQRGFTPILVILFLGSIAALGLAGWLYLRNLEIHTHPTNATNNQPVPTSHHSTGAQPQLASPPLVVSTSSPPHMDGSQWKTYTNGRYGYEFRYPPEDSIYQVDEQASSSILLAIHSSVQAVRVSATFFSHDPIDYSNFNMNYYESTIVGRYALGGNIWIKYVYGKKGAPPSHTRYSLFRDGVLIQFDERFHFSGESELQSILATLRLINSPERLDKKLEVVKIGNTYGDLIVASIAPGIDARHEFLPTTKFLAGADNTVITFMGRVALQGTYDITPGLDSEDVSFHMTRESAAQVPQLDGQFPPLTASLTFNNNDFALSQIKQVFYGGKDPLADFEDEASGTATIVVENVVESFTSEGTFYSGELVNAGHDQAQSKAL